MNRMRERLVDMGGDRIAGDDAALVQRRRPAGPRPGRSRPSRPSVDMRLQPVERRQAQPLARSRRARRRRRRGRAARRRGSGRGGADARTGRSRDASLVQLVRAHRLRAGSRKLCSASRDCGAAPSVDAPRPCTRLSRAASVQSARRRRRRATAPSAGPACRPACARSCPASDRRGRARDARFPSLR